MPIPIVIDAPHITDGRELAWYLCQHAMPANHAGVVILPIADVSVEAGIDPISGTQRQELHATQCLRMPGQLPARSIEAKQTAHVGDANSSVGQLQKISTDVRAQHLLGVVDLYQGTAAFATPDWRGHQKPAQKQGWNQPNERRHGRPRCPRGGEDPIGP